MILCPSQRHENTFKVLDSTVSLVEETHAIPAPRNLKNEPNQTARLPNQNTQQRFSLGNKG